MKNTLGGIDSMIEEAENWINDFEDKVAENNHSGSKEKKEWKKKRGYDVDPGPRDPVLWWQYTNTQGLQKSCWEKGAGWPLSKLERALRSQPKQAFVFLGTLHQEWSSFPMHRFTTGDYLLRTTKDRTLLITSKRRMLQLKGEIAHTPYLGGLAQILGR